MKLISFFAILFTSVYTFAQESAVATATAISSPAMDQAQSIVDSLGTGWTITIAGVVIELLLRVFKTQNPKSLLYVAANILKMVAKVSTFLAESADKVLQRTKDQV